MVAAGVRVGVMSTLRVGGGGVGKEKEKREIVVETREVRKRAKSRVYVFSLIGSTRMKLPLALFKYTRHGRPAGSRTPCTLIYATATARDARLRRLRR